MQDIFAIEYQQSIKVYFFFKSLFPPDFFLEPYEVSVHSRVPRQTISLLRQLQWEEVKKKNNNNNNNHVLIINQETF